MTAFDVLLGRAAQGDPAARDRALRMTQDNPPAARQANPEENR